MIKVYIWLITISSVKDDSLDFEHELSSHTTNYTLIILI